MSSQDTGSDQPKKKILIAEDNPVLGEMYKRRFELEGFSATLVSNGVDVQAVAIEYEPDLVILDIMMPGANGLSALELLRKAPETHHLKVFVFSALDQASDKDRALRLGADEYLVKSKDMLMDVIDRVKREFGIPVVRRDDDDY